MSPRTGLPLTTEFILLGLLAEHPMHGYDLYRALQSLPGLAMIWRVKQSMAYALLDKLAGQGYLETQLQTGGAHPPRKVYSVTPAGQAAFQTWRESPVAHARDLRMDFLARLYFARRCDPPAAEALITRQEAACRVWLERLQRQWDALTPEQSFERCVFSFRIRQVEGILSWLAECARGAV